MFVGSHCASIVNILDPNILHHKIPTETVKPFNGFKTVSTDKSPPQIQIRPFNGKIQILTV